MTLSYKPLRQGIAKKETQREEYLKGEGLFYRFFNRLYMLFLSDRGIILPSKAFSRYLNDLQLAGVWDSYNQIEDAERGSRLALFKLPAKRLRSEERRVGKECRS